MKFVKKDSPKHVVLYAMLRWFARYNDVIPPEFAEIVVVAKLQEDEYPVKFYGDYVYTVVSNLKERGYIEDVSFHGKVIGVRLTEKGTDTLEELGTPTQYDH